MVRCLHFVCLLGLVAATGCQRSPLPSRAMWYGTVQLPEIKIPFRMELDFSGPKPAGYFLVSAEMTPIPEISRDGDALIFGFSEYGAEIRARWDGRTLAGNYVRLRSAGTKTFPFTASPDFLSFSRSAGPLIGDFEVLYEDRKPGDGVTLATFRNEGTAYVGTFIAPDGDYGVLEGTADEKGIQFNRVTGWQAIAIELHQEGREWIGKFHAASNDKPRAFKLQARNDLETVTPAEKQTTMKDANKPFTFACTALSGETVRNTDERFKGKALAVDIMGTWCHNCMDESPVLQELQNQYGKDGFEVVGLSFEVRDDAEIGRRNLTLYRDRFGLTYPLLYCGSVDDASIDRQLRSQLNNFFAYPTTLFIDKRAKVQSIHTGFHGRGTGDRYSQQVRRLHALVQKAIR